MEMLLRAYDQKRDDPYIIDSVGWAYYLTEDYISIFFTITNINLYFRNCYFIIFESFSFNYPKLKFEF